LQALHMVHRDNIQHLNLTNKSLHTKLQLLHWISFGSLSVSTFAVIGITLSCIVRTLLTRKATVIIQHGNQEPINKDQSHASEESTPDVNVDLPPRQPRYIPQ
jgi:hypothetical protein